MSEPTKYWKVTLHRDDVAYTQFFTDFGKAELFAAAFEPHGNLPPEKFRITTTYPEEATLFDIIANSNLGV